MRDSSSTAARVCVSAWVVESAAVETPVMLLAISVVPPAASCTDRDISFVVAVCSSTAEAMVVCRSEICATMAEISSITDVSTAADATSAALGQTRTAVDELSRMAGQLRSTVGRFTYSA